VITTPAAQARSVAEELLLSGRRAAVVVDERGAIIGSIAVGQALAALKGRSPGDPELLVSHLLEGIGDSVGSMVAGRFTAYLKRPLARAAKHMNEYSDGAAFHAIEDHRLRYS
jgi:hypothetical protein